MNQFTVNILCKELGIEEEIIEFVNDKEKLIVDKVEEIERIREYNQYKVIAKMQEAGLSSMHFNWTTGYGYGDVGRKRLKKFTLWFLILMMPW